MRFFPLITPVILAGGKGERLWPLSRQEYPKQILPLTGEASLLQETVARVSNPRHYAPPLIICNEAIRFIVSEQLQDSPSSTIVIEPIGRNTAPAIAIAALMLKEKDPHALMLVLPSDHIITDTEAFLRLVEQASASAREQHLATFGIAPHSPHTGFGYIECGTPCHDWAEMSHVTSFTEKPDRDTAIHYMESGSYLWNSGIFLMSASSYLRELQHYAPEIFHYSTLALDHASQDMQFLRLDPASFSACPSNSIDYAVMEKTDKAVVIHADMGWSDLGNWQAIWDIAPQDQQQNSCHGDIVMRDCTHSYIHSSDGKLLACMGLDHMVVVSTNDATLVTTMDKIGEIKQLTETLKFKGRREIVDHTTIYRPWGQYSLLVSEPGFQVKRIIVKPRGKLSLQSHYHRSEHWVIVHGIAKVTCEDKTFLLHQNESTFIPTGSIHRLENAADTNLELIEIQTGLYFSEDDIVRFDDVYGREFAKT